MLALSHCAIFFWVLFSEICELVCPELCRGNAQLLQNFIAHWLIIDKGLEVEESSHNYNLIEMIRLLLSKGLGIWSIACSKVCGSKLVSEKEQIEEVHGNL